MIHVTGRASWLLRMLAAPVACAALALAAGAAVPPATPESTPASGPSWLANLERGLDQTALGRVGALGPNEQDPELSATRPEGGRWLREGFAARGADLFRYTCRACHGAGGKGLPPEILPLVARVRATSVQLQAAQGPDALGTPAGRAGGAEITLRHRVAVGGVAMPPLEFLTAEDTESLLGYLEKLAQVPDPKHQDKVIQLPVDRVGEQIVKGTCQICHDAKPGIARTAADRDILPLAAMTSVDSLAHFVAKSRHRGAEGLLHGRGPELRYLRDQELAAVYFYLAAYPPR